MIYELDFSFVEAPGFYGVCSDSNAGHGFNLYIKLKALGFFILSVDSLISMCAGPVWVSGYKIIFGSVEVEILLFVSVGSGVGDGHFLFMFSVSLLFDFVLLFTVFYGSSASESVFAAMTPVRYRLGHVCANVAEGG